MRGSGIGGVLWVSSFVDNGEELEFDSWARALLLSSGLWEWKALETYWPGRR